MLWKNKGKVQGTAPIEDEAAALAAWASCASWELRGHIMSVKQVVQFHTNAAFSCKQLDGMYTHMSLFSTCISTYIYVHLPYIYILYTLVHYTSHRCIANQCRFAVYYPLSFGNVLSYLHNNGSWYYMDLQFSCSSIYPMCYFTLSKWSLNPRLSVASTSASSASVVFSFFVFGNNGFEKVLFFCAWHQKQSCAAPVTFWASLSRCSAARRWDLVNGSIHGC